MMENMEEENWNQAAADLSTSSEGQRVKANHFAREVVELAGDWLRHRDALQGSPRMQTGGDESPDFAKTALAIGTGIQIALWGIRMDDNSKQSPTKLERGISLK